MDKKISIILPVYNCENYIKNTLEALINQTYKNIEIICINDGSVDNSLLILEEYKNTDNRINVYTQRNSGPAHARNIGLKNATGDYIMFCDSDDTYELQMCEKMVSVIETQGVPLVMCKANLHFDNDIYRQASANVMTNLMPIGKHKVSDFVPKDLSVLLWHKIFKKSIIDKYQIAFPDGLEWDDSLFCYEYYSVIDDFFVIEDKLYNYLIRDNSVMDIYLNKKNPEKIFDKVKIFNNFYQFLTQNNLYNERKNFYNELLVHNFILCFNLFETKEQKERAVEYFLGNIHESNLIKKYKAFNVEEFEVLVKTKSIKEILGKKQNIFLKLFKFLKYYFKYYNI